ncbi:MAG: hypothetical protein KF716_29505 [Anaerolineae bacterium]|nr:hypothetical protein [Anaerolineae bacterium]
MARGKPTVAAVGRLSRALGDEPRHLAVSVLLNQTIPPLPSATATSTFLPSTPITPTDPSSNAAVDAPVRLPDTGYQPPSAAISLTETLRLVVAALAFGFAILAILRHRRC